MGRFGLLECQEQDHRSGDPTFCIWLCVFCPWFQTNIYGLQDQFDNCSIAHNASAHLAQGHAETTQVPTPLFT